MKKLNLSWGGGISDFDELNNKPQESETIYIEDLDLPMPAKPTEYPVLFDETGTEYQVGWYKRADGKVKPVYRKDCLFNNRLRVSHNSWTTSEVSITNNNIESIKYCFSFAFHNRNTKDYIIANYPMLVSISRDAFTGIALQTPRNATSSGVGGEDIDGIIIEFTKTTDEFRDL